MGAATSLIGGGNLEKNSCLHFGIAVKFAFYVGGSVGSKIKTNILYYYI